MATLRPVLDINHLRSMLRIRDWEQRAMSMDRPTRSLNTTLTKVLGMLPVPVELLDLELLEGMAH